MDQGRIVEMAVALLNTYGAKAVEYAAKRANQFELVRDPANADAWARIADSARAIAMPRSPSDVMQSGPT